MSANYPGGRPKPITVNYFDPACLDCAAAIPHAHQHRDGLWYVPSDSQLNWTHRIFWHQNRRQWQCSCPASQVHGRCKHIENIQPLLKERLTRSPYPRVIGQAGLELFEGEDNEDEDYPALFERLLIN